MQALVLGCSHAAGSEMIDDAYGRANSYPVLLAERMGYTVTNLSIPGGSNDAVFRIFQEQCNAYHVVIACWTGIDRVELWDAKLNTMGSIRGHTTTWALEQNQKYSGTKHVGTESKHSCDQY
jgi:hypothetical protein